MIFVDANIPMYIVGGDHPNKREAQRLLELAVYSGLPLATHTEVLQEILHRYAAIGRLDAIGPAFDVLLAVVDQVFPITLDETRRCREILEKGLGYSARDALHLAIMERHQLTQILTFDVDFDRWPAVNRFTA